MEINDYGEVVKKSEIIDSRKEKSVVRDKPDERRMRELEVKEIQRLKNNQRYMIVTDFEYGAGARRRRNAKDD